MVKLLMLITSLAGGGAERVASELSLHLDSGIDRRIVTLVDTVSYPSNKPPIPINYNFFEPKWLSMLFAVPICTYKYRKLVEANKPNISMSFLTLDNIINVISNIGNKNTRVILQVHIALSMKFSQNPFHKIIKKMIQSIYNRADTIIAVSEGVRDELIECYGIQSEKVIVIHNPNNIEKIQLQAQESVDHPWFSGEIPIIFNMGRLTKQKGQWHLIRAFAKVREQQECKLVIRGDGELKEDLQSLVTLLGLSEDVLFLPWVENPYKYISKATVFVFSSLWEALPYALIEAMACGCPVIATDCKYGPREIIGENEYGILVSCLSGDYCASGPLDVYENELANKIIPLLNDDPQIKLLSLKAKERASHFDLASSTLKYRVLLFQGTASTDDLWASGFNSAP